MTDPGHSGDDRDRGAILILVLAVAIVLSLVVLALANFVAADLRYSQVVNDRAKTLSSAESGIDYAVDRLRLNQTLCATKAASGEVNLNGTSTDPVGTALPQALNGTDTRVTCERLDDDIADVAGWAVVIYNPTVATEDQLDVDMLTTATFGGPMYLADPATTLLDEGPVELKNGDLWYHRGTASACEPAQTATHYTNSELQALNFRFTPAAARGGTCTTRAVASIFETPDVMPAPAPTPSPALIGSCQVFYPGTYDTPLTLDGPTYFWSGVYHITLGVPATISGVSVWAGAPDPAGPGPVTSNPDCAAAQELDMETNGGGAVFYHSPGSTITVSDGGTFEIFGRQVSSNHIVALQSLTPQSFSGNRNILATTSSGTMDVVIHGLVWAPHERVVLNNSNTNSKQQLLGGVVVRRLGVLHVPPAPTFQIMPATSAVDTGVLLRSTSTLDGASTTVEAVVQYRPHATDPNHRVAVNSLRVVD
jgi:Tfp pilus assembly protein PilX